MVVGIYSYRHEPGAADAGSTYMGTVYSKADSIVDRSTPMSPLVHSPGSSQPGPNSSSVQGTVLKAPAQLTKVLRAFRFTATTLLACPSQHALARPCPALPCPALLCPALPRVASTLLPVATVLTRTRSVCQPWHSTTRHDSQCPPAPHLTAVHG